LLNAVSDAAISRLIQRRTSGGADRTCSTENVKPVIGELFFCGGTRRFYGSETCRLSLMQINRHAVTRKLGLSVAQIRW